MQSEMRRSQGGGLFGKFLGKVAKAVLGDEGGAPSRQNSGFGGGEGGRFGGPGRYGSGVAVELPEADEGHRAMARQIHSMVRFGCGSGLFLGL